ncbi:hypothetical protein [Ascidiimonas sp. W6]|uniref:hypothetical protein n=1 Tax=Ascidiimonas meishanensis TaxID=3128903 RepID=UPI0030EE706C
MEHQNQEDVNRPLLNRAQITGIQEFGLTIEQVQVSNFGQQMLSNIRALQASGRTNTGSQAFQLLAEFNTIQGNGIAVYELTRADVNAPTFGIHTLDGIDSLQFQNPHLNEQEAFNQVNGLNATQVRGVTEFNLTPDQVNTNNFGQHTLSAMTALHTQNRAGNMQEAFTMVRELNNIQAGGMGRFGLEREQVFSPNFDMHTLMGMAYLLRNALQNGVNNYTNQDAFETVRALNAVQVRGVTDFQLIRDQVLNPRFGNDILKTIQALQTINPEATNQYLLETAMELPEYQIRGFAKLGLLPEQLGLTAEENRIIQLDNKSGKIASGSTIDAIDHLMSSEYMNREQAFETAFQLETVQVLAMTDFGLSLEQVQHPCFQETASFLEELVTPITNNGNELSFPLSEEQQQNTREVMEEIISTSNSVESTRQVLEASKEGNTGLTDIKDTSFFAEDKKRTDSPIDLNAFAKAISLKSVTEKNLKRSRSDESIEDLKPAAKNNNEDKKSTRKMRKP